MHALFCVLLCRYSRSAEKMAAFIRLLAPYSHGDSNGNQAQVQDQEQAQEEGGGEQPQQRNKSSSSTVIGPAGFRYLLKLDDDNAVDLARIVCSLATLELLHNNNTNNNNINTHNRRLTASSTATTTIDQKVAAACAAVGLAGVHPFSDLAAAHTVIDRDQSTRSGIGSNESGGGQRRFAPRGVAGLKSAAPELASSSTWATHTYSSRPSAINGDNNADGPPQLPQPAPAIWWSSFRQARTQYRRPYGNYWIPGSVADARGARVHCLQMAARSSKNSGAAISTVEHPMALPTVLPTPTPAVVGKWYQLYAFGGSHVLSASVVQWLASTSKRSRHQHHQAGTDNNQVSQPGDEEEKEGSKQEEEGDDDDDDDDDVLTTDVWMEDVSFGIWVGAYARAHGKGALYLLDDPRWLETAYGPCAHGVLGMNLGGERAGVANLASHEQQEWIAQKHMRQWQANLATNCGNGCGCSNRPMVGSAGGTLRFCLQRMHNTHARIVIHSRACARPTVALLNAMVFNWICAYLCITILHVVGRFEPMHD